MTEKKIDKLKEWEDRIYESMHCETTVRKWCEQNGISKDSYYYWKREVEKYKLSLDSASDHLGSSNRDQDSPASNDEPVFVEIPLTCRPGTPSLQDDRFLLEKCFSESKIIIQRDHFKVYIGEGFNKDTLQSVLEVVGHA